MIISEKQIMQLMAIANGAMQRLAQMGFDSESKNVAKLIDNITNQQSD